MKKHPDEKDHTHHDHKTSWTVQEMIKKFNNPQRDTWQKPDEIIALFGEIKNKIILDLGAGAGYFTFKLAKKETTIIAMDIEQSFLDYISKTSKALHLENKIIPRLTTSDTPEIKPEEVDGILIIDTYHHITNKIKYLQKLYTGLKEYGKLIILEHPPDKCIDKGPPLEMRIPPHNIVLELTNAGFMGSTVNTELLSCHYIIIAEK